MAHYNEQFNTNQAEGTKGYAICHTEASDAIRQKQRFCCFGFFFNSVMVFFFVSVFISVLAFVCLFAYFILFSFVEGYNRDKRGNRSAEKWTELGCMM